MLTMTEGTINFVLSKKLFKGEKNPISIQVSHSMNYSFLPLNKTPLQLIHILVHFHKYKVFSRLLP